MKILYEDENWKAIVGDTPTKVIELRCFSCSQPSFYVFKHTEYYCFHCKKNVPESLQMILHLIKSF